ncbi:MAG: PIG-L family deacetylase [Chloroflexi bacterium]|nr:PIG-L family deacetylase [Chloroflexota bacterium]
MPEILSLMCVHAHPDDEHSTAGSLLKYAGEGAMTSIIYGTRGECGLNRDPRLVLAPWETLADVRTRKELKNATALLKVGFVNFLGYRDSGMAGTVDNENSHAFCNADMEEACRRLVLNIRKLRPQVLVTYNENGGYGHPDHIMCNRVTTAAFELAGDPDFAWDDGERPWQPKKLYYTTQSRENWQRMRQMMEQAGFEDTLGGPARRDPATVGTPEAEITAHIDVTQYVQLKRQALLQHRSQVLGTRWEKLPEDIWRAGYSNEYFMRARCLVDAPDRETDLFAGLRDEAIPAADYTLRFAQPVGTHFVA